MISIHAPLAGCDHMRTQFHMQTRYFNPRTPRGVRRSGPCDGGLPDNFNPRTPRGVRPGRLWRFYGLRNFNPRTPRGVRLVTQCLKCFAVDFNPRTPRGVRLRDVWISVVKEISIHAPLAGCDARYDVTVLCSLISIHAPLAGCDKICSIDEYLLQFQSTHPSRGATDSGREKAKTIGISIHAPLAGCDGNGHGRPTDFLFQSTHPSRGATQGVNCGRVQVLFQSTHPSRGATVIMTFPPYFSWISIHAPLAGCDFIIASTPSFHTYFNPRTPRGVRHCYNLRQGEGFYFNPRTPRGVRPV